MAFKVQGGDIVHAIPKGVGFRESVYYDYNPEEPASLGQTINVPIPAQMGPDGPSSHQVADIGVGDFTPITVSSSVVPLVFNQHPGVAFVVSDFSQYNTPSDIRKIFLDSALKGILEYVNHDLASLFTTGNFNIYSGITSATPGLFATGDMVKAWGTLAGAKIPVRDFGNFFTIVHPIVYGNMTNDTTWSANSQVGYQIAGETRRYAMLGEQWGALIDFDPAMPTGSAGSPSHTTYTGAVFHRHAVALACRPLAIPDTPVVLAKTLMLKDLLPVRVMLGYVQLSGGWVVTIDCAYARAVIRPDFGIIVTS